MKFYLRLDDRFLLLTIALAGLLLVVPVAASAQSLSLSRVHWERLLLLHSASQGYLGVEVTDIDSATAQNLKLKEVRGAVVTMIDHDAPAGKIGIHVNDVILQLNGQNLTGTAQLRLMLRETPAGHKVHLLISRDGGLLTFDAELADRRIIAKNLRNQMAHPDAAHQSGPAMGLLSTPNITPPSHCIFHWWNSGDSLNVGATVELLTPQMAEYFGVPGGLMIKSIVRKSEADASGFKPHDLLLRVGNESISTLSDWERALHANQNKPVVVAILRDYRPLTLTLQVDSKRHKTISQPPVTPPVSVVDSPASTSSH